MGLLFDKNYKVYITSILISIIFIILFISSTWIDIEFTDYNDKLLGMYIITNFVIFALTFLIVIPITIVINFIMFFKKIFMKNKNVNDWIILCFSFLSFFIFGLIEFFTIGITITL